MSDVIMKFNVLNMCHTEMDSMDYDAYLILMETFDTDLEMNF